MWLELSYQFLGGLGIFFFGMKTLSEALQAIAGDLIQKVINALTTNRLVAVGVGALVTTIVQSSSVTTVMIVGLVNANLMALTQAIGVILGANIGTTITGWIIAIKVGKYGLLFVGLGSFPYIFAKKPDIKNTGKLLIALGFIFMGLEFMSGALKPLRHTQEFMDLLVYFTANSYASLWACVLMGALLTCIIQSSSAMLAVTIALAATGSISFQTAVALVLGENIGTTITALLASVGTNSHAKRAARAHAVFNLVGVLWITPLFWKYTGMIENLIGGSADAVAADGTKPNIAAHIAASHTIFNVVNTLLFLPFLAYVARFVTWITPAPSGKETATFKYLPNKIGAAPSLALAAANKELVHLGDIVEEALFLTKEYVLNKQPKKKSYDKIMHLEDLTDTIQTEITVFLCKAQEARMSEDENAQAYAIIRSADELESVADYCASMARYRNRLDESGVTLTEDANRDLTQYIDHNWAFFMEIHTNLKELGGWDVKKLAEDSVALTQEANRIWDAHRERLRSGKCNPVAGMLFSDFIVALRKNEKSSCQRR